MFAMNKVECSTYLDDDEDCDKRCGEVFLTTKGNIVFHCTLCESKYKGYDEYAIHVTANHTTTFDPWVVKEESNTDSEELQDTIELQEQVVFHHEALKECEISIKDIKKKAETQIVHESCQRKADTTAQCSPGCSNIAKARTTIFTESQVNNHIHDRTHKSRNISTDYNAKVSVSLLNRKPPRIEPDYKCSKCDKSFSDYMELKDHMTIHRLKFHREHFKEKTEPCDRSHDKKKSDKLVTPIPECNREESSTFAIEEKDTVDQSLQVIRPLQKRGLSTNISSERRKYKCPICGYAATDKSNLKVHIRRHTEENQVPCPVCSKKFFTKSEVKIHMRSHTHEKPFLCTECGGKYATNTQLVNHMKRHTNQRDYKCTQCEKSFFNNAHLKKHIASHLSDRQFACNICPAKFVQRAALRNHLKLHANKREYKCELCDAGFNQKAGLYSHMKTTHKTV